MHRLWLAWCLVKGMVYLDWSSWVTMDIWTLIAGALLALLLLLSAGRGWIVSATHNEWKSEAGGGGFGTRTRVEQGKQRHHDTIAATTTGTGQNGITQYTRTAGKAKDGHWLGFWV
ncbi:hypothetical protein QBC40DRAFT_273588 [Triangularia verruculosa]|uniref:Uncharacterized protein n=1 Tax=Triangularia verruculosa TaxID=2587418 RepID=A0AAN6XPK5_9PEZI|nr:hypothetical protein QBC40DRAFT_273588 [Triangularia verruculosa]